MKKLESSVPKGDKWGYKLGIFFFLAVTLACAWIGIRGGHIKPTLFVLSLGVSSAWYFKWMSKWMPERIVITDDQIEAWTDSSRYTLLRWDEIQEIRQFSMATRNGPIKIVRLIPSDKNKQIFITERVADFAEIMQHVRSKTPHAQPGKSLTLGERIFWGGYHMEQ